MDDISKIEIRLFAGFLLSSEIRMHLNQSPLWKRSSFEKESPLIETHHSQQDYLGIFLEESHLPLTQVEQTDQMLRNRLAQYCPNLGIDHLSILLFPQIFIG